MTDEIKKFFLKATVDRIENNFAIIKTEDKQEILWPIDNLPEDAKEGSTVRLNLSTSKTDEEERVKLAKSLLEEILRPDQK